MSRMSTTTACRTDNFSFLLEDRAMPVSPVDRAPRDGVSRTTRRPHLQSVGAIRWSLCSFETAKRRSCRRGFYCQGTRARVGARVMGSRQERNRPRKVGWISTQSRTATGGGLPAICNRSSERNPAGCRSFQTFGCSRKDFIRPKVSFRKAHLLVPVSVSVHGS